MRVGGEKKEGGKGSEEGSGTISYAFKAERRKKRKGRKSVRLAPSLVQKKGR